MSEGLTVPSWLDNTWETVGGSGSNVATQTANTSTGQDGWSGFFQNLIGGVVKYAVQKDAAGNNLQMGMPQQQPIYVQAPAQQAGSAVPPIVWFAGLGLLAYIAVK